MSINIYKDQMQKARLFGSSVLSPVPLKNGRSKSRLVRDMFELTCVAVNLKKCCADENIRCLETPIRHMLCPASPDEVVFFYAQTPERDEEMGGMC